MGWLTILKRNVKSLNNAYVSDVRNSFIRNDEQECLHRKMEDLAGREARIIKSIVDGTVLRTQKFENVLEVDYIVHWQHLIKQTNKFHIEDKIEERRAIISGDKLIDDYCLINEKILSSKQPDVAERDYSEEELRFQYSRLEAVRYAERWWNDYNTVYKKFDDNCTNFISQCLHAGGAPMAVGTSRSKGWWYRGNNWSFSWSVAHSLRWYLSGSKVGLRAIEVVKPEELIKGDVICYDFDGDGKWQHTTIVVAKDVNKMPLVNAQTTNSRMRYWAYEDSTAWTENIKYKFFHIADN
ncbi:amidase domain-containing protein [Bacillaceae bacterium IKA-2]|nr:amidase domain-containing protein [Bacillaceae bacterium IKA-2]